MMTSYTNSEHSCSYQCYLCDKDFASKYTLKRHQENIHGQIEQKRLKCMVCEFEADSKKCWLDHFQYAHGICVKSENLEFASEEDFLRWKEETERNTRSKFIKSCGTKRYGAGQTCYYVCHRSGQYVSRSDGIRHLKLTGSNKINGKCPAEMKVLYKEGKCYVTFVSTHIGHDLDLSHLSLSEKERLNIAEKIALGIPFPDVLKSIQQTVENSNLERVHLTTMQDLHNIASAYSLSSKSVRHPNDAMSVEAWVQEVQQSDNPCVLFYKPQETVSEQHPELRSEDFMLVLMNSAQGEILKKYGNDCICVDGTHGLNGYDFEVTTLLVLDDMRQGFPCAFLISNRTDSDVFSIFFNCIKTQVGQICPNVFMSDLAESYSIGWNRTMGNPKMRLFCSWHVIRAWKTNIKNKIQNDCKRNEVYKLIKAIMELRNVAMFEKALQAALQKLGNDPETDGFAEYFRTHYEKNVKSWAYCHRIQAGINTNMHLESMHKTLKYIHGNAKQVKRLDKGISTLMSLVTAKLFDRLIVSVKGKLTSKMKDIRRRHSSSILLNQELIRKVGNVWEVPASKSPEVYVVEENNMHCNCKLVCTDCKVCIHRYSCTCIDYSIKLNMCKHIHSVCQMENTEETPSQLSEVLDALGVGDGDKTLIDEREVILKQVSHPTISCTPEALSEEKKDLLSVFSEMVSGMSAREIQMAKKMVTSLKVNIGALRSSSSGSFISPQRSMKRKLVPQRRLFSTKKTKSSRRVQMANPGQEESHEIVRTLLDEGSTNTGEVSIAKEDGRRWEEATQHGSAGPASMPNRQCLRTPSDEGSCNNGNVSLVKESGKQWEEAVQHGSPGPASMPNKHYLRTPLDEGSSNTGEVFMLKDSIRCEEVVHYGSLGSASVCEEHNYAIPWYKEMKHSSPGPVILSVMENENIQWKQNCQHSTQGPVNVAVEQNGAMAYDGEFHVMHLIAAHYDPSLTSYMHNLLSSLFYVCHDLKLICRALL